MTTCVSKIEVTNGKSGAEEFYWSNTNEYRNMSESSWNFIQQAMVDSEKTIKQIASGKADDGLTVTWGAVIDGVASAKSSVSGVSYSEWAKIVRQFYKLGERLVEAGEKAAPNQDKKRSKHMR